MTQTLKIHETFLSLQGESSHAGRVCSFVRLMGCPLRCKWCDTEYAFYDGKTKSFDELFATLAGYGSKLVEVTGGEPLAQTNCIPFLQELGTRGYEVLLETSGALAIDKVPSHVKIIMDLKAPGSGEQARNHWDNIAFLKPGIDEVKIVVADRADFDFAVNVERQYKLTDRFTTLISPVHGKVSLEEVSNWIIESKIPFRFQVQLHKYIWGAEAKGV